MLWQEAISNFKVHCCVYFNMYILQPFSRVFSIFVGCYLKFFYLLVEWYFAHKYLNSIYEIHLSIYSSLSCLSQHEFADSQISYVVFLYTCKINGLLPYSGLYCLWFCIRYGWSFRVNFTFFNIDNYLCHFYFTILATPTHLKINFSCVKCQYIQRHNFLFIQLITMEHLPHAMIFEDNLYYSPYEQIIDSYYWILKEINYW